MRTKAFLGVLMFFCAAVLPSGAQVPSQLQLPTWPQNFSLVRDDHVMFGIPVTRTGDITVTVQWAGVPLDIALRDLSGKVVTAIKAQAAPSAKLSYHVSDADLARGVIWGIVITCPPGSAQIDSKTKEAVAVAKGTVSATYPDVDMAALRNALSALDAKRLAALKAAQAGQSSAVPLTSPTPGRSPAGIRAPGTTTILTKEVFAEPNRMARIASQTAAQRNRFNALSKVSSSVSSAAVAVKAGMLNPSILGIMPGNGYPGDTVTITAVCVEPDPANYVFRFVFDKYGPAEVKPSAAKQNPDYSTTFTVTLPSLPADTSQGQVKTTQVEMVCNDRQPAYTSARKAFQLDYVPVPAITSVTPTDLGLERDVTILGTHFLAGSTAHFVLPDGSDQLPYGGSLVDAAKGRIQARLPMDFGSVEKVTIQVYVMSRDGKPSAKVPITAGPTGFLLSGADKSSAEPGEAVLITGKGFRNPTVTYDPDEIPGEPDARQKYSFGLEILSKCETAILAKIPDWVSGYAYPVKGRLRVHDYCETDTVGQRSADSGKQQHETTCREQVVYPFSLKVVLVDDVLCPSLAKFDRGATKSANDMFWEMNYKDPQGNWKWVHGHHLGQVFWGFTGNDILYVGQPLSNGWTVTGGKVYDESGNGAGARLESCGDSNLWVSSPFVNVRWYADGGFSDCSYSAVLYIRGPRGTKWNEYFWR